MTGLAFGLHPGATESRLVVSCYPFVDHPAGRHQHLWGSTGFALPPAFGCAASAALASACTKHRVLTTGLGVVPALLLRSVQPAQAGLANRHRASVRGAASPSLQRFPGNRRGRPVRRRLQPRPAFQLGDRQRPPPYRPPAPVVPLARSDQRTRRYADTPIRRYAVNPRQVPTAQSPHLRSRRLKRDCCFAPIDLT